MQYSDTEPAAGGLQSTERAILDVRNLLKDLSIHEFLFVSLTRRHDRLNQREAVRERSPRSFPSFQFMNPSIPAVPIPSRANPRALAFFKKKWANSPGWGHISCLNAPGWGRRMRANALPRETPLHFFC